MSHEKYSVFSTLFCKCTKNMFTDELHENQNHKPFEYRNTLLVRPSPERIRYAPTDNQTK